MKLCSIISGSSGNCVYLETDKSKILIDAGASGRRIQNGLKEANIDPKTLDAIFLTHEHGDHIQGAGVLSRRFKLPIFATYGTWEGIGKKLGRIDKKNEQPFRPNRAFHFNDIGVYPFSTYHDAIDPVGYVFSDGEDKVSIVSDTGKVDRNILKAIKGSQIYYFESNHDEEMLLYGPYPPDLKRRIKSDRGHLSNNQAARALRLVLEGKNEVVLLSHMSAENNEMTRCRDTVVGYLQDNDYDFTSCHDILVAPRYEPSPMFDTKELREGKKVEVEDTSIERVEQFCFTTLLQGE